MDYKSSGVDIEAGNEVVRRIKALARSTNTPGVLSDLGSFGGLFAPEPDRPDGPVLVASADGVGTKLKGAFLANRHDTIGEDLVNHCVNDILVQGATPLFFPIKGATVISSGSGNVSIYAIQKCQELGAGVILPTSMDGDGTLSGYDLDFTKAISDVVTLPVVASGGAGKLEDFYEAVVKGGADILLAASVFHYRTFSIREVKEYLKQQGLQVIL